MIALALMTDSKKDDEPKVTPEGQRKGDDIIRRMVNTPPKPHKAATRGHGDKKPIGPQMPPHRA